ncbi:MAG: hypothetical protein HN464_04110 [Candidatus Marinimicrobia bacterium]|jgi:hypothetical protein|nr:hypothetical protein [Candidatus Neomarinimicrobiota bacterium]MBT5759978.1 hypothetical protein [Candidatus Neomarinimicrobiota bacterium]MBT7279009.1 hypothetical protein [Candidatus Neomarinimicrobiota bacterium]
MLKGALKTVNEWLELVIDLLKTLIVVGIVVGILFDDFFGVIAGLGRIMAQFGDAGFAGILALMILVMWYDKK